LTKSIGVSSVPPTEGAVRGVESRCGTGWVGG
jgi:hypothetical protein